MGISRSTLLFAVAGLAGVFGSILLFQRSSDLPERSGETVPAAWEKGLQKRLPAPPSDGDAMDPDAERSRKPGAAARDDARTAPFTLRANTAAPAWMRLKQQLYQAGETDLAAQAGAMSKSLARQKSAPEEAGPILEEERALLAKVRAVELDEDAQEGLDGLQASLDALMP